MARINRNAPRDPNWIQWTATAPLLGVHLGSGASWPIALVIGLCLVMTAWYGWRLRSFRPFPIQIRIGFLGIVGVGLLPGMGWLLWLPLVGTTAQVLVGYCPMARLLALMPWNRAEALSRDFARRVIFGPPGNDGLVEHLGGSRA